MKILALLIVTVVVLGVVGWRQFIPTQTGKTISSTMSTSPTSQTIIGSTSQAATVTTLASSQTTTIVWINAGEVKPVSYYLSLLESNGTQPYVQLAAELRKLPDFRNATAIAQITYLALNATNPEVKEAFELMLKGGTPDPRDFQYPVPNYNTELQVLYWLAVQNEFKKDDTLALAIAMVNGLWITIGDDQVREAVHNDTTQLLRYFRETNELQRRVGRYQLEEYSLEAKLILGWTANYSPSGGRPYPLRFYVNKKLPLTGYEWNTVSVDTLRKMRDLMDQNGWVTTDVGKTIGNVEYYFYFDLGPGGGNSRHWRYSSSENTYIEIDGQKVLNHDMNNVGFEFNYFLQNGFGIGDCGDESGLVDAFAKSWGVATTFVLRQASNATQVIYSHMSVTYYEPKSKLWQMYEQQANVGIEQPYQFTLYILRPPVNQVGYLDYWTDPVNRVRWFGNMYYIPKETFKISEIKSLFLSGISDGQMKQWLLYS